MFFDLCLAIGGPDCIHPDYLLKKLNRRQIAEWTAYVRLYSLGADRASIDISHQTWHMLRAWIGKDETRLPTDLAPQFDTATEQDAEVAALWADIKNYRK